MRNLKRTLSLALAAVMLMGMMVVGAGAASSDFTDADEIKNVEAVDVMVALGILEGGDKGDFQPNSILTREQAAKIICYMLLGEEAAEKLATSGAVFTDVAADRWSAPFIGYCVNLGILAGDGQGHFFPEGKLTGAAFAKMLLVALGYDPKIENYTGNSWTINVAADAIEAGISPKGLVLTNELSRQDAAQMAFQTLTANMVKYDNKGIDIDFGTGSGSVSVGASTAEVVPQGSYDDNMNADNLQFAEKYFTDLKLIDTASTIDKYGRPAHAWKNGKDTVGTYADKADAVYTEDFDKDEIAKDYNFVTSGDNATKFYNNGVIDASLNATTLTERDYKGTVIELYADKNDNLTQVVLVQAYAAEVTTLTKTTITLKVYNPWHASKYISVSFKDDTDKKDDTFDTLTASYEKGDYMLTYFKGSEVNAANFIEATDIDSFDATVTTKKISSVGDGYNGYFTVDGTKYTLASAYNEVVINAGSAYTFYTDDNGYVIAAVADTEKAATIDDVYYIAKVWKNTDTSYGAPVYSQFAQVVALDGTIQEVELESKNNGENPYDAAAVAGKLVTLSDKAVKSGDTVVCKANNDKFNVTEWAPTEDWAKVPNVTGTFTKDATRITVDGETYRLNSDTKYVMIGESGKDLSATVKTGGIAYTVKTGGTPDVAYFITAKDSSVVSYVVIGSASEISEGQTYSKDTVYLADIDAYEEGDGYYARKVYFADGTEETWQLDSNAYDAGFYTYDKNSDGYYTLKVANAMSTAVSGVWDEQEGVVTGNFKSLFENLLTIEGVQTGDRTIEDIKIGDAVVVDVHDTDAEGNYDATVSSIDELNSLKKDNVITNAVLTMNVSKDGAVVIFITDIDAAP